MKQSKEFLEKKELIRMDKEFYESKHKFKMEELIFGRESTRLFHEMEMERQRIKSAEIRKFQMRKQEGGYKY